MEFFTLISYLDFFIQSQFLVVVWDLVFFSLYILVGSRKSLYEWLLSRYYCKSEIFEFCFQIDSWVSPERTVNSESSRSYL